MGEATSIQWTEKTWNPWHGCIKISPGCKNCYMYRDKKRYGQDPTIVTRSKTTFRAPLKWKEPAMIFTCSWSDWFIEQADEWREDAWDIIRQTPQHTYQILTKRPERVRANLPYDWGDGYPNVWLGVSVENRDHVDRIFRLVEIPAAIRFVSAEPLLEGIDIDPVWLGARRSSGMGGIDWVIIGGESGGDARPCEIEWIRDLTKQAWTATAEVFVKQLGSNCLEWVDAGSNPLFGRGKFRRLMRHPHGGDPSEWPEDLRVREMPDAPPRR